MKQTLNSHPEEEPNREIAALMESERPHLLRYACYRLGNADDAEDAVQDIFLQLHTKRQDAGGQPLTDFAQLSLSKPFPNFCTDRLRRRQVREFVPIEQVSHICEEQVENFEREFRLISTLLAGIPEEQAEVIRLRIHGNNSFSDIAAILDIPVTTAKSRFQYGIEKIRKGIKHSYYWNGTE